MRRDNPRPPHSNNGDLELGHVGFLLYELHEILRVVYRLLSLKPEERHMSLPILACMNINVHRLSAPRETEASADFPYYGLDIRLQAYLCLSQYAASCMRAERMPLT